MDFFKKVWNKIKQPHGIWLVLFYICFVLITAGTIVLVCLVPKQTIGHIVLYPIAAVMLTYFVYTMVYFAPKMKSGFISLLQKFKFTNTMLENHGYRAIIFAIFGFVWNCAYVAFMGVLAIMTKSAWYISITAYYLILSWMKGNVLYSKKKYNTEIKKAKAYRFCGIMFILLMLAFSGVIVLIYTTNMYFEYAGIMIYAVAAYTFFKLVRAIIGAIKSRNDNDLYLQSLRNINLSATIISIIVLQVAMFQAFAPEHNQSIANGLTGGGVALVIFALGIYMIVKANKRLKELKQENNNEK